jgi:hypothetical protein
MYFRHCIYNNCPVGVIVGLTALFGKGKTLTSVHIIANYYNRYQNKIVWCRRRKKFVRQKIRILSNVKFTDIEYEPLTSLQQIVDAASITNDIDDALGTLTVTLVLIDEASAQLNSRKFKDNINPLLLNSILTCRHHNIAIYYTAQRSGHVDALMRQVTSYYVE